MSFGYPPRDTVSVIDVKISIPELSDSPPFWIRDCGIHETFEELLHECMGAEEVQGSRTTSLQHVRASRHFWHGERMLLRQETLETEINRASRREAGNPEMSLVLRRDYYRVMPSQYVAPGIEYTYLDAELPIRELVLQVLNKDEKGRECCFDLWNAQKGRLNGARTLASYGLWPAWPEKPASEFPAHAVLALRPRTSWQAYLLLGLAAILGVVIGYLFLSALLH